MLVLARRADESIYIGEDRENPIITITVLRSGGGQVRLGIKAPDHLKIWRGPDTSRKEDKGESNE